MRKHTAIALALATLVALASAALTTTSRAQDAERTVDLSPGCNMITLTFAGGTEATALTTAVSPAGALQTVWRLDNATGTFQAFMPQAPQASDLTSLQFLDAVFLCTTGPGSVAMPWVAGIIERPSPPPPTATPLAELTPAPGAGTSPTDALQSFAFALEIEMSIEADGGLDITAAAEGLFEAPDSLTCTVSASLGGLTMVTSDLVIIGDDAWIDTGDGFRATRADDPEVTGSLGTCPGSPTFWKDFEIEELTLLPGESGTVNGVAATHYPLGEAIEALGSIGFLPSELEAMTIHAFDIWVAEDGAWVVRLVVDISLDPQMLGDEFGFPSGEAGQQLRLKMRVDITDVNSPDIHVEPPAS